MPSPASHPTPLAFTHMTRREWLFRGSIAIALTLFISLTYFASQHLDLRPVHWLSPSAFDRAIPADPRAIYLYVTFYPFLWATGLICDRMTFRRYVLALVGTAIVSSLVFILFPTGVARSEIDPATAPALYRFIETTDLPRNALPSEHASLSIIAGIVCWRALPSRPVLRAISILWIALILWSTLATRQHVVADLASGAALGTLVWIAIPRLIPGSGKTPPPDGGS